MTSELGFKKISKTGTHAYFRKVVSGNDIPEPKHEEESRAHVSRVQASQNENG